MTISEFFKVSPYRFARIDQDRERRKGFPEVIFGQGKTISQSVKIALKILQQSGRLLITRTQPEVFAQLQKKFPLICHHPLANCIYYAGSAQQVKLRQLKQGHILFVCAGTSDIPIAEEAALTAKLMGCEIKTLYDVGVAGIHRLLAHTEALKKASVIVVVAGMDAALPSVIGGLTDKPIIAVPTSVGYGSSFEGLAALLSMLNACSPGITVVNIDNGFGAGYAAGQILKLQNLGIKSRKTKST